MTMGTAPVPPRPMWRRDRTNAAVDSDAEDESRDKPNGYVFLCPFVLPTLLFFLLFFFPVISFAAEYNDELTARDRCGRRQKRAAERGGKNAYSVVSSLVSLLSSFLLRT